MSNILNSFAVLAALLTADTAQDAGRDLTEAANSATREAQAAADAAVAADTSAPKRILRVTVIDGRTGAPVANAGTHLGGRAGLGFTDAQGQDEWRDDFPQTGEIIVRCPAKRSFAGKRFNPVAYAAHGELTEIVIRIDANACIEPPERTTTGRLSGHFYSGFEYRVFIPCGGLPADAGFYGPSSDGAWVEFDKEAGDELEKQIKSDFKLLQKGIYVTWDGDLKGPGSYGHLGGSSYEFQVHRLISLSMQSPQSCPSHYPSKR